MKIDITPMETHLATSLEHIAMDMRGIQDFYCFYFNGKKLSVNWTEKELEMFVPLMTVSEFIESHILGGISTFVEYHSFIVKGLHPFWDDAPDNSGRKGNPLSLGKKGSRNHSNAMYYLSEAYKKAVNELIFVHIKK
jgi:hypothetical protein